MKKCLRTVMGQLMIRVEDLFKTCYGEYIAEKKYNSCEKLRETQHVLKWSGMF